MKEEQKVKYLMDVVSIACYSVGWKAEEREDLMVRPRAECWADHLVQKKGATKSGSLAGQTVCWAD